MTQVNMLEAKSGLSKLIKLLEDKKEDVIYIARRNKIVAEIKLHERADTSKRIGSAKGVISVPEEFGSWDQEVMDMFGDAL